MQQSHNLPTTVITTIENTVSDSGQRKVIDALAEQQAANDYPDDILETAAEVIGTSQNVRSPARGFDVQVAAALSLACRVHDHPEQLDTIVGEQDTGEVRRERLMLSDETGTFAGPISTAAFLDEFLGRLDVSDTVASRARDLVDEVDETQVSAAPSTKAAAAIWAAVVETSAEITQKKIGEVAGVTPVSIRSATPEDTEPEAEPAQ